jgi:hypothetical protein
MRERQTNLTGEIKMTITHQERKANRAVVYNNAINYIQAAKRTVKINNLYELMGKEVFSSAQYFVQCFIKVAKVDPRIHLHTTKKGGTFAACMGIEIVVPQKKKIKGGKRGRKPNCRKVQMGGSFGIAKYTMTGRPVTIEIDEDVWALCKKAPKTFDASDMVEVYRMNVEGQPMEYLQITNNRQFHFTVNA